MSDLVDNLDIRLNLRCMILLYMVELAVNELVVLKPEEGKFFHRRLNQPFLKTHVLTPLDSLSLG